jgi:hypothetical protein
MRIRRRTAGLWDGSRRPSGSDDGLVGEQDAGHSADWDV